MGDNLFSELARFDELCRRIGGDHDLTDASVVDALMEGETHLKEMAEALLEDETEIDILEAGVKAKLDELKSRQDAFKRQKESIREVLAKIIERTPDQKMKLALGTVSMSRGAPRLQVIDATKIPFDYFKSTEPALDSKAVLDDLKAGIPVEGATLDNGAPSLKIRKK